MLSSLSICDVVLIGRLDLEFRRGLCVLTGETGAGKSILLDALGLGLGERADARLVRHGASQASVTARFEPIADHPAWAILSEQGIGAEDDLLLLRRVLSADGRSRAFVNDQPVSIGLLKRIGGTLVEVHGQFESQRLLDPAYHRVLLDAFGRFPDLLQSTSAAFDAWRAASEARIEAADAIAAAQRDEEFFRHAADELTELAPQPGEESRLAERRALMMHAEQLLEAINGAARSLADTDGAEARLQSAARELERVAERAGKRLNEVIAALDRALNETTEAMMLLDRVSDSLDLDPNALDHAEERLFALRALARKHAVDVDDLAALADGFSAKLTALEDGSAVHERLRREEDVALAIYVDAANRLRKARTEAATSLDEGVNAELKALKLGKAVFTSEISPLDEGAWNEAGFDRVVFTAAINPGGPAGPLNKIASGGEMARFMLAIKAVLAEADPVPTVVFDEVDAGVGGAVAAAVGERLAKLANGCQVMVVTHSPQVAARGTHHWRVSKSEQVMGQAKAEDMTRVWTSVEVLDDPDRKEEIARMLAGAKVTDEARAAADSLLAGAAE
ncbi:MAG: DNA repair protein RecN [Alphaproteobacteria bacterium MarineAlpha3_Bin4]|nr:MAG: DNA repair protein RecN [Alphaproteobacteria bacterium MarineAlpha3_Bin4]